MKGKKTHTHTQTSHCHAPAAFNDLLHNFYKNIHLIYCIFLLEICRGLFQVQQQKVYSQRKPVATTTPKISGLSGGVETVTLQIFHHFLTFPYLSTVSYFIAYYVSVWMFEIQRIRLSLKV